MRLSKIAPYAIAFVALFLLILVAFAATSHAAELPQQTGAVINPDGWLSPVFVSNLTETLATNQAQTGVQIVVVVINPPPEEEICATATDDTYAQKLRIAWNVGGGEAGRGVVVVFFPNESIVQVSATEFLSKNLDTAKLSRDIMTAIVTSPPDGYKGPGAGVYEAVRWGLPEIINTFRRSPPRIAGREIVAQDAHHP